MTQTLQSYLPLCFQCQKDGLKQRRCNAYLMNEWIYEFMKPYHDLACQVSTQTLLDTYHFYIFLGWNLDLAAYNRISQ